MRGNKSLSRPPKNSPRDAPRFDRAARLHFRNLPTLTSIYIMSRESKAVLINHGSHTLRAGYGIHNDLFRRPTYELTARVGLPRAWLAEHPMSGSEKPIAEDYVVGVELDRRIEAGEEFEVYWPMRKGVIRDWQACIALW